MSDRVQTVLKWFVRFLWFVAGGGALTIGYGGALAAVAAASPEAYAGTENLGWIAKLISGGSLATFISGAVAWAVNFAWGKIARGKAQPFAQYTAATGAVEILTRYLGEHPSAAVLPAIGEACGEVFMAALKPTSVVVVETK